MKFKLFNPLYLFTLTLFVASCSSDDDGGDTSENIEKSAVIENYANLVYQSYLDSYTGAVSLQTAVDVFIETPTDADSPGLNTPVYSPPETTAARNITPQDSLIILSLSVLESLGPAGPADGLIRTIILIAIK